MGSPVGPEDTGTPKAWEPCSWVPGDGTVRAGKEDRSSMQAENLQSPEVSRESRGCGQILFLCLSLGKGRKYKNTEFN